MITVVGKGTNNISKMVTKYKFNKIGFLSDVKNIGTASVDTETPILSGYLKSKNTGIVGQDFVSFFNPVDYFVFVHFGTMYMAANPYMARGLTKANNLFVKSLISNLKI